MKQKYFLIPFLIFTCLLTFTNNAQEKQKEAKLGIKKVSLFKNGFGFFNSVATLPDATSVRLGQLPIPSFGTFWVSYGKDVKLHSLVTSMEESEEKVSVQNLLELLRVNEGKKVRLTTNDSQKPILEGVIIGITEPTKPEELNPYFMGTKTSNGSYNYGTYNNVVPPYQSELLMIKTTSGTVAINVYSVLRVDFDEADFVSTSVSKQKMPSIRIELDQSAEGKKIFVNYLAKGVTWAPSYYIDISDPQTARFSAHALVVNELADFNNVKLELVTGFPNMKFGEVPNPIAKSQTLAEFLNTLSGIGGVMSGSVMTQQAVISNIARYEAREMMDMIQKPNYSNVAEGLAAEDLFLYPVENFSLKKGETAWIPLFSADMKYAHIYTWAIPDFIDQYEQYQYQTDPNKKEEVWHSIKLTNSLKMPLTTAAVEFVKDGSFVGQDVCYYTAPNSETTVRINLALNVIAEQAETEVKRTRNAANFYGYNYDLVQVKGELKLKSRIDKQVDLEITKELSGEVLTKSDNAEDVQTAKGLKKVNPKHILTWKIKLDPGKEKTLSYIYQVYVRN